MDKYKDDLNNAYDKNKARFYAEPRFAGIVGFVVGVLTTLLFQWIF